MAIIENPTDPSPGDGGGLPDPGTGGGGTSPPPQGGGHVFHPEAPFAPAPIPPRHRATAPPSTPKTPDTPGPGIGTTPVTKSIPTPIEPQAEHRTYTFTALADWAVPLIYGPAKVGSGIVYGPVVNTRSDGSALACYWISWGEISSLFNFLIDGKPFTTYNMSLGTDYNVYLGTNSQGVDPLGLAAEPTRWSGKTFAGIDGVTGKNIAYLVARFPRPGPGQPAPNLQQFTCEVHGRLVLDPRNGVDGNGIPNTARVYSDNPALCLADYMTSPWYGAAIPLAQMDWTGTITDTANACDFNIGGGVKRFTIGGMITKRSISDNIDFIRGCAQILKPVYNNGVYQIIMDLPQTPSTIVLSDTPGSANVTGATDLNIRGSREVYDRVILGYTDVATDYKDNTVNSTASVTTTDPNYVERRFDFPLIPTGDQATRIANYLQKKSKLCDRSGTIRAGAIGTRILPGMVLPVTYKPWGWSLQNALVTNIKPVGSAWDVMVEQYDANAYSDSPISVSVFAAASTVSPYDVVPEIITRNGSIGTSSGSIYFGTPVERSTTIYGASAWTATNLHSYTAAAVNDGDLATACFDWNISSDSSIAADLGSAKTIREIFVYTTAIDVNDAPIIEYSDNGSSWTADNAAAVVTTDTNIGGGATLRVFQLGTGGGGVGAHRYWRLRKNSASARATTFTEIWPREYATSGAANVKAFRVYSGSGASRKFYNEIPVEAIPTSGTPFDVNPITSHVTSQWNQSGSDFWQVTVTVISTGNIESSGTTWGKGQAFAASGGQAPYIPQQSTTVTLANGANRSISLPVGPGAIEIGGPTGAFSIDSIAAPAVAGVVTTVYYNGAQTGTVTNQDGASTAADRIRTMKGVANIAFGAGAFVLEIVYSAIASRWIVVSARDDATGVL